MAYRAICRRGAGRTAENDGPCAGREHSAFGYWAIYSGWTRRTRIRYTDRGGHRGTADDASRTEAQRVGRFGRRCVRRRIPRSDAQHDAECDKTSPQKLATLNVRSAGCRRHHRPLAFSLCVRTRQRPCRRSLVCDTHRPLSRNRYSVGNLQVVARGTEGLT